MQLHRRGFLFSLPGLAFLTRAPAPDPAWVSRVWRTMATPVYISRQDITTDLLKAKIMEARAGIERQLTMESLAREPEPGEQLELFDITLDDDDGWD